MKLNRRQTDIIKMILESDTINSESIAACLHVSSKTVRNEINQINSLFNNLIVGVKSQGYSIADKKLAKKIVSEEIDDDLDIQFNILKSLIKHKSIDMFELADNLFISESLLQKEIKKLNKIISTRNDVKIIRKNNNLMLIGNEEDTRMNLVYFFMREINHYNLSDYQNFFDTVDLEQIKDYTKEFYRSKDISVKDVEILSSVMHVAIMFERIQQNNFINNITVNDLDNEHYSLAKEYYDGIKDRLTITLDDNELAYLGMMFAGNVSKVSDEEVENLSNLIDMVFVQIKENYGFDFAQDAKLKNNLIIHFLGMKGRIESQNFLQNPMIEGIKRHFPILYDVSIFIALKLQDYYKVSLFEGEISFITLHLMGSVERIKCSIEKNVVVISQIGRSGISYIEKRLNYIHDLKVNLLDVLSTFELSKLDEYNPDLVLLFDENITVDKFQCFRIRHMLNAEELEEIYKLLKFPRKELEFNGIFEENLFFVKESFNDKKEAIHYLCEKVAERGYVDKDFEEYVLQREEVAPTSYGTTFSIPHPIVKVAKKNKVAVCIVDNPIQWNEDKIKIIFLICAANKADKEFDKLFEMIVSLFDYPTKLKKLEKVKTYDEFIRTLLTKDN